ncbi:MAG: glycosyl transferase family 2, partial [Gammaproteobacteria bacterium]|nr:glycosyl transferase family 2 [Gemmatimonadota bacterium]NIU73862.1 glycosyl transferase family 2 [Gammaproteobacteria bacterium]NIY08166.1 glycosyl transferase family 2 [Gemmatimonadota bacterium]
AFRLDGHGAFHRFIELGQALRERWLGLVYGDQGLLVSRSLYDRVGGYPDWPLMEDV